MYIRDLIQRNSTELAEAVPIVGSGYQAFFHASSRLLNFIIRLMVLNEIKKLVYVPFSSATLSLETTERAEYCFKRYNKHSIPSKVGQKVPFSQCSVC